MQNFKNLGTYNPLINSENEILMICITFSSSWIKFQKYSRDSILASRLNSIQQKKKQFKSVSTLRIFSNSSDITDLRIGNILFMAYKKTDLINVWEKINQCYVLQYFSFIIDENLRICSTTQNSKNYWEYSLNPSSEMFPNFFLRNNNYGIIHIMYIVYDMHFLKFNRK